MSFDESDVDEYRDDLSASDRSVPAGECWQHPMDVDNSSALSVAASPACHIMLPISFPVPDSAGCDEEPLLHSDHVGGPDLSQHLEVGASKPLKRLKRKTCIDALCSPVSATSTASQLLEHPALKVYHLLPADKTVLVQRTMAARKCRLLQRIKSGKLTLVDGQTFLCAGRQEPNEAKEMLQRAERAFLVREANKVANGFALRGWCIEKLLPKEVQEVDPDLASLSNYVVRHKYLLLTYQGDWGWVDMLVQEPGSSVDEVAVSLQDHPFVAQIRQGMIDHFDELRSKRALEQYVFCIEVCPDTWKQTSTVRLHVHVFIHQNVGVVIDDLEFRGSRPYVSPHQRFLNTSCGTRARGAVLAGAYYCQIHKIGQICSYQSGLRALKDFSVKDWWITSWYSAGKISAATAKQQYLACAHKAESNIRQLQYVENARKEEFRASQRVENERAIQASQVAFRTIESVTTWEHQFTASASRRLFLVLDGPSGTGKTRFAYSLAPAPSWRTALYADCSGGVPDLRSLDNSVHKVLILDELSPGVAIGLKKLLQGSNDPCTLGHSPTMHLSYSVVSAGIKIIITTNTWSARLENLEDVDADWLKKNSIVVEVTEPLWVG
jgi:hypothetical protein